MPLTYAQLTSLVEDYLQQFDTTLQNDISFIVRQAEDNIHKAVFMPNFKKSQIGNMQSGDRFLTAPTDFVAPLALALILASGVYTPLLPKEVSAIYEMYPVTTATAPPKYYALFSDSTFLLGPTPDQSYQAEFQYFYKPPSIVDVQAGTTTWLSQNAEHTLFYAVLAEALRFQKAEQDIYAMAFQEYQHSLNDLRKVVEGMDETDAFRRNEIKVPVRTTSASL